MGKLEENLGQCSPWFLASGSEKMTIDKALNTKVEKTDTLPVLFRVYCSSMTSKNSTYIWLPLASISSYSNLI